MNWRCIISLLLAIVSVTHAINCLGPATKLNLKDFDVFPSPVSPGEYIYARANLWPSSEIASATVNIRVFYSESADIDDELPPIVEINGVKLCEMSTMITCPLKANSTILAWDFLVPSVPPGVYQVQYYIIEDNPADGNPNSCIQFPITIAGIRTNELNSHYQATLLGTAVFSNPDYSKRTVGDLMQVGPMGPLGIASPAYGQIKNLKGTGDLVPNPYYETTNFIWGMNGTLDTQAISSTGVSHTYTGSCYLGYVGNGYTFNHNNPLLECNFKLTWTYKNSDTGHVSGTATFFPSATIPKGWGFPLLYGRLGEHQVVTSDSGFLMITGSITQCANGEICSAPPPNNNGGGGSGGLSSDKLGLAIGIPLAALFIAIIVGAALLFFKRKRETEQEDGIFAVARKPEYGSALVVDDIIEESRGSKTLQAMLDVKEEDDYSDHESDDESERSDRRGRSRTPASRSSRSRSRSSSGRSNDDDDDSDPGESADRRASDSE